MPRQDPSVVAALMTQVTSRIGIVPTFGTFAYPPYLLARLVATLDQVSAGRIGWNAVTGSSDFAAMNFGLHGHAGARPALRHGRRIHATSAGGCGPRGSRARSSPTGTAGVLVDPTKVHAVNYEGQFYKTRGPLNSGPARRASR